MRVLQKNERRVSAMVALAQTVHRTIGGIHPRIAILSLLLALSTGLVLWVIGEMLIEDGRVGALFTVAMSAITVSLARDIYRVLVAVRLPVRH